MTEVVVAVYHTARAAEAAMADLEVAGVPTTTIRQFVSILRRTKNFWRSAIGA
jgi:hypothetical protein